MRKTAMIFGLPGEWAEIIISARLSVPNTAAARTRRADGNGREVSLYC
jgi:hypothetical protein